jgi:hypothetical protein
MESVSMETFAPLEELVPQATMLEGILSCLEIGLVRGFAVLEPRNILGWWDRSSGGILLAAAHIRTRLD